jgi:hypothetical protein
VRYNNNTKVVRPGPEDREQSFRNNTAARFSSYIGYDLRSGMFDAEYSLHNSLFNFPSEPQFDLLDDRCHRFDAIQST